jgi:hypothetical protein
MRTELEIKQAKDILQRARNGAATRDGKQLDIVMLRMFIDLLGWIQGEPSAFGTQLEVIRKRIDGDVN